MVRGLIQEKERQTFRADKAVRMHACMGISMRVCPFYEHVQAVQAKIIIFLRIIITVQKMVLTNTLVMASSASPCVHTCVCMYLYFCIEYVQHYGIYILRYMYT